jgi:hypothetical protein
MSYSLLGHAFSLKEKNTLMMGWKNSLIKNPFHNLYLDQKRHLH